jgi:hypothetical protein
VPPIKASKDIGEDFKMACRQRFYFHFTKTEPSSKEVLDFVPQEISTPSG